MSKYAFSGKPRVVTIHKTGEYEIVADGAAGGSSYYGQYPGGRGAEVGGTFHLTKGEKLEIVAGGTPPGIGGGSNSGGGGSFVLANTGSGKSFKLLLAAGGGGGADYSSASAGGNGQATSGSGYGGRGEAGAGGAGYKSDGTAGGRGSKGGSNRTGNYAGGDPDNDNFGGGGQASAFDIGGGGGGGYSGGNGGGLGTDDAGSGGYSIDRGSPDIAVSGENAKSGFVTLTLLCFVAGTRIRTVDGDVPVERLRIGDLVVTASGAARPVRWLGHRTVDCRRHPDAREAQPIRIAAHAFGACRPARDLVVSPGHAICVDVFGEVLIPAGRLMNGTTIAQMEADDVTYWHVELDDHDILLAENLPCESYIDCGGRAFFANTIVVDLAALPDPPPRTTADYCRPFHREGTLVEAAHARLAVRARALMPQLRVEGALGRDRVGSTASDHDRGVPNACEAVAA